MSSLVIQGDTSGSVSLSAPAIAGTVTVTLPSTSGTMASLASVTANGVAYLNGSKVLTTGSALTFDGTNSFLGIGPGVTPSKSLTIYNASIDTEIRLQSGTKNFYLAQRNATGQVDYIVVDNAAQTWSVNNTEAMRIASAAGGVGAVGIGYTTLTSVGNNGLAVLGNVGIGTSNPTQKLTVNGVVASIGPASSLTASSFFIDYNTTSNLGRLAAVGNTTGTAAPIYFSQYSSNASVGRDAAIIDSSGNLLVGTTSGSSTIFKRNVDTASASVRVISACATTSNQFGISCELNGDPNNTTNYSFAGRGGVDGTTDRAVIRSNGGLANYSANNVNLSDRREKTNFAPAKSYLDVICAIPVQTYNYIDQNMEEDGGLTLGVVAQDVQEVAPELVTESNWGTQETPKMRLSIYQTDMQYALMKCIQEQQALITQLTARITALESA